MRGNLPQPGLDRSQAVALAAQMAGPPQQVLQMTPMNDAQVLGLMAAAIVASGKSPAEAADLAAATLYNCMRAQEKFREMIVADKIREENARRRAANLPLLTAHETGLDQVKLDEIMKDQPKTTLLVD